MKKITFLFSLFFATVITFAQCPPGNVAFSTQAELNQFVTNYPNCSEISGNLQIGSGNQSAQGNITNLSPLANITRVNGTVYIQNNALLQNLNGLNIVTITGRLYIGGDNFGNTNSLLQNVDGLSSLTSVGQFLQVVYHPVLNNLNGLSNLTSIGQDIEITGNAMLSNISGLQHTTFNPNGGYGLTIVNNAVLAVCNLPNFCSYLANPSSTHPRTISGNLAECLNEAAVASDCGILSIDKSENTVFSVYPNPVSDMLNLSSVYKITNVNVINMLGQTVMNKHIGLGEAQIDMSVLAAGNYFIKAAVQDTIKTIRVVKQ